MILKGRQINLILVLKSAFWSIVITFAIRLLPLRSILNMLTPKAVRMRVEQNAIINSVNAVLYLQRKIAQPKCWKKSMLYFRMLKKYGHSPVLHFGVALKSASDKNLLSGHSWVSIDNVPIAEQDKELSKKFKEILVYS
ncbi:MAG TPA: lasso peptide biosynthesis B2 protein [bacterium]